MSTVHGRVAASLLGAIALLPARADEYQVHGLYLGDAPSGEANWGPRAVGLAHDDTHWYITQKSGGFSEHGYLWRIPVTADLENVSDSSPGVLVAVFGGDAYLGDPCVHRFNGVDYLLLPYAEGISVWEAVTLTWIAAENIGTNSCAVDASGTLYIYGPGGELRRYGIDWPALQNKGVFHVEYLGSQPLYAEDGASDPGIDGAVTGLEFTPDGRFLYLVNWGSAPAIHVFDPSTWSRVLRSTDGPGPFQFSGGYHTGGLTVWDFDAIPSWTEGQLHVIVRDTRDELVYLKHYTRSIRVRAGADPPGDGRPGSEFPTVTAALELAWPGSEIRIIHGNFDEALTISKRVRLRSVGGATRIGG